MNTGKFNLLTTEHLQTLAPCDQYAAYASAYLESSKTLCADLVQLPQLAKYEKGNVVLYLASHAIELFLKGAIMRKAPEDKLGHDLEHLYNRYKSLYPENRFHFDMGFTTNYGEMTKQQAAKAKKIVPPIDQLFRYPQDRGGKLWFGLYAFEANSFMVDLKELEDSFARLLKEFNS